MKLNLQILNGFGWLLGGLLKKNMTKAARRTYRRNQVATVAGRDSIVLAALSSSIKRPKLTSRAIGEAVSIKIDLIDDVMVALKTANVRSSPDAKADRQKVWLVMEANAQVASQQTGSKKICDTNVS